MPENYHLDILIYHFLYLDEVSQQLIVKVDMTDFHAGKTLSNFHCVFDSQCIIVRIVQHHTLRSLTVVFLLKL